TTVIGQSWRESPHTRSSLVLPGDRQRKRGLPCTNRLPKYAASRSVNWRSSLSVGRSAGWSPRIEILRLTPAASTRASTQADTQRWHSPLHQPRSPPHSGASPSDPSKVYRLPSMRTDRWSSSSSAHDTTYLSSSRDRGSRSAFIVSAFIVSAFIVNAFIVNAFIVSAFIVNAFIVSAFIVSALSVTMADSIVCSSSTSLPQPPP